MSSCNLETLLITREDFNCVGQVAKHCDWDQLCIYIREQQNATLLPKIGFCIYKAIINNQNNEIINTLLCGGEYLSCNGGTKYHFGIKRALIHWSYGAYIYRHSYIDTPFGVVQKVNENSMPAPINELKIINNEQVNLGNGYFEMVKDYLCSIKSNEIFKDCNFCDCDCECNTCKGIGSKTFNKRTIQIENIRK